MLLLAEDSLHNHTDLLCPQITLVDFLTCSRLLLAKTRRVLIADTSSLDPSTQGGADGLSLSSVSTNSLTTAKGGAAGSVAGGSITVSKRGSDANLSGVGSQGSGAVANPLELNYLIWQTEMERGFEALVASILPYVRDLSEAEQFASFNK